MTQKVEYGVRAMTAIKNALAQSCTLPRKTLTARPGCPGRARQRAGTNYRSVISL
jgi:hypothetical protein